MTSIKNLKERWEAEKEFFKNKELGELQDFVKEVLQLEETFNLKKGRLSTLEKKRKHEFTEETNKKGRRADFVIYIDGKDIIIPVEVERHNNIEKGKEQIFRYQKDWDKKYGILTDGNEWRFYKSNRFKSFYIEEILESPKDFKTYWQYYIKPENYYIDLFEPNEQGEFFGEKINLNIAKNREIFFDDITKVIDNFTSKMKSIGAFGNLFEDKKNEKIAVETSYAYLIQFILYKVLVDNNYKKFNKEYKNMFARVQKAIKDEDFYQLIVNDIKNISEYISKHIYNPFKNEQAEINKKLSENLKSNPSIDEIAGWLDMLLFINRYNFSGLKNEIFGYIYENFLKDLYQEKNKGQYFTDPAVVNFMLEEIGYKKSEIKKRVDKNKLSIIDVSCGAGTFLYSAAHRIVETFDDGTEHKSKYIENLIDKNIFGLDIEEFPLYLAEMNILMRLLPIIVNDKYENPIDNKIKIFKTNDSISEFLDVGIGAKEDEEIDLFDHNKEVALPYKSFMRDGKDLEEMLISLGDTGGSIRERFDYVIGNPPYISYNECCRQKINFTKKINDKKNNFTMGDVHGVNLHSVSGREKKYPPKPNLYAFFIALGLGLLKKGAKMSYIIPQTILTANDLDVLRYHLSKFTTIEKIITFYGNMFIGRGLKQNKPVATSSLIFVLKKEKPKENHKVEIINYKPYKDKKGIDFEKYIAKGKQEKKKVLQSELKKNIANWNFLNRPLIESEFANKYIDNSENFDIYATHKNSATRFGDKFYFDIGFTLDKKFISQNKKGENYSILDFKNFIGYSKYKATDYYPKDNSKIKLTKNNQGHITLSPKYSIVWRIKNPNNFHITSEPIIFNMGASSIITSNNHNEMLYIFSLLNSVVSKLILEFYLKIPAEKEYQLSISSIKNYIRMPKITSGNQFIKVEIIKQTENLLSLEDYQLNNFVEFNTSIQKFKKIYTEKNNLILIDLKDNKIIQKIKTKYSFIKKFISELYTENTLFAGNIINLSDIKYLEAIDKDEQAKIKNYIDDLVFALYFNIPIKTVGINKADKIKEQCLNNKFYKYICKK